MDLHRTARRLAPLALAVLSTGCSHLFARSDDALEPNDDTAHATPLTAGQSVKGRANQGNADVFSLQAAEGNRLVFRLESLGLEDCPAFTVTGPDGQVLYRDQTYRCHNGHQGQPAERVAGAEVTRTQSPSGYEVRAPAARAGTHFLTIHEQGEADNVAPYSWDYQLTAQLE